MSQVIYQQSDLSMQEHPMKMSDLLSTSHPTSTATTVTNLLLCQLLSDIDKDCQRQQRQHAHDSYESYTNDNVTSQSNSCTETIHENVKEKCNLSASSSTQDLTLEMVHLTGDLFDHDAIPQLLPCKHWLEVSDPHHRYGTYLRPYYDEWRIRRECPTEGFFKWLDEGQGQYIDIKANSINFLDASDSTNNSLTSKPSKTSITSSTSLNCISSSTLSNGSGRKIRPRHYVSKDQLDKSVVHYCDEEERLWYQVEVRNDETKELVWKNRPGKPCVHTTDDKHRWIFVIDEHLNMYVNVKKKAQFHHSSFVAGAPVRAAGRLELAHGHIQSITPNSGHYCTSTVALHRAIFDFFGECTLPIGALREDTV